MSIMKGKKGPLANGPRKGASMKRGGKVASLPKPGKTRKGGYGK